MPFRRRASRYIILTIVAAAGLYLVGNGSVSLWDRDEPRYAQTSRQMLQSGDWVVPRLLDETREKKPVFIYGCQASAMKLIGENAFAARLPSAICVTLTLIVLATVLWRMAGPRRALWTTFIFASSALTIAAAKMCITDGVLILFVAIAQLCLYAILNGRATWPITIACGVAVGFGLLTKGPVVPAVMLMSVLALGAMRLIDRPPLRKPRVSIPKWLVGIALGAAVYSSWGIPIEKRLPGYHLRTIKAEVLDRAAKPQEGHTGPPGYYLLSVWGTFFPWSLLLPAAMVHGWRNRRLPPIRFALAAAIGPWLMFEIVRTKLPHYLLPVFPALAFLTADMLIRAARQARIRGRDSDFASRTFLRVVLIWGGIVALVGALPWLGLAEFGDAPPPALYAMILLPILSLEYARSVYIHFRAARPLDAAAVMGIGMAILVTICYGLYLPNAPFLRMPQQVADVLIDEGATHRGDAMMIDYKEMSLAFYQGGTIRPQRDNDFLINTLPLEWPRWIVISEAVWKRMPDAVQKRLEVVRTVRGLNYAGDDEAGHHVFNVLVLRKNPSPLSGP